MALLGAELACVGGGGPAGAAPSKPAVREIPASRLRIYQAAGRRFDIEWAFLASIGTQECGDGLCADVYPSGCGGPMQIAIVRESACSPGPGPTIWERFEVDGDGDGRADPFDLADSIFTAAHILRADLGAPPVGGSYAAYRQAACSYYGACADGARRLRRRSDGAGGRIRLRRQGGGGAGAQRSARAGEQGPSCEAAARWRRRLGQRDRAGRREPARARPRPRRAPTAPPTGPARNGARCSSPGSGSTPGSRCAAAPRPTPTRARSTNGRRPTAVSCRWVSAPAPGDAVLFGYGPTASEHVGIVERVFPDGEIMTIDGNFGDRVARVGPFPPALAVTDGEPAPIYAYAQPPGVGTGGGGGVRWLSDFGLCSSGRSTRGRRVRSCARHGDPDRLRGRRSRSAPSSHGRPSHIAVAPSDSARLP